LHPGSYATAPVKSDVFESIEFNNGVSIYPIHDTIKLPDDGNEKRVIVSIS